MTAPRLEAFKLQTRVPELVPCTTDRVWMDAFPDRHAYRCLPLTIANAHGWEILAPGAFEISWNGRSASEDLTVRPLEDWPADMPFNDFVRSHFSRGIVTFHTGYLFRTPPGWSLLATGPFNEPRTGICPLTGIMESDWLPYPFTMNWQMVTAGTVRFEKDESFCAIIPIPKNYLGDWDVALHDMTDDPVLSAEQTTFREARDDLMARINAKDPEALKEGWQRHYFVGRHPDGTKVDDHVNKLRLADPLDLRGTRPLYARDAAASKQAGEVLAGNTPTQVPLVARTPVTHWQLDSVLNELNQNQDETNHAGRRRLQDGILQRSPETLAITPDVDPDALDFIYAPGFLTPDECALLVETAKALSDKQHVDDIADPYWKGRITFFNDVLAASPEAAALMRAAQHRITERLREFYRLTSPAYADTVQLVQWREGMFMQPHADRANPDGARHDYPHRDFGSIVYLNDDYDGGELYFTRLNMTLKPTAGMLVAFTGGWHHEHGVLRVGSGLRLTMPAFYTFERGRMDWTFYE